MKVMWFSINASMLDEERFSGSWTASLEMALKERYGDHLELAVVFETIKALPERIEKNGTVYYPIPKQKELTTILRSHVDAYLYWKRIEPAFMRAVQDFRPEIIQCFGTEWMYGMIAEDISVPIVIHMQGFLNVYYSSVKMIVNESKRRRQVSDVRSLISQMISRRWEESRMELERRIMAANRFFMGRTDWDRMIVRYYSPGARYYQVQELIRPLFREAAGSWRYKSDKLRLLTVSLADSRKGVTMTLRACKILRELTDLDYEWRVAGSRDYFAEAEIETGIRCSDVGIHLLGYIEEQQIVKELQEATLFVHPSVIDNSPNSICEAQLVGCPVIASYVGGVGSLVRDGETGFLYPYNEPHTLAFRIADLARSGPFLTKVSENAVREALARHDPVAVAESVWNVYLEVLETTQLTE